MLGNEIFQMLLNIYTQKGILHFIMQHMHTHMHLPLETSREHTQNNQLSGGKEAALLFLEGVLKAY